MIKTRTRAGLRSFRRHPLRWLFRKQLHLLTLPAVVVAALMVFTSGVLASGGPDGYLLLGQDGFVIRFIAGTPGAVVDWANSGPNTTNPSTCGSLGTAPTGYQWVHLDGTGGVFDCGLRPLSTNPFTAPLAPSLTSLAQSEGLIFGKNAVFIVDALGSDKTICGKGDPTVFTGQGSETNNGDLNTFTYNTGSVPTKDEISNAYAIVPPKATVHELFFGAERIANNGDTHIDFEFLQAGVTIPAACGTGTTKFSGHRTKGDFLAAIDFTTGGALGGSALYIWSCDGTLPPAKATPTVCDPGTTFPNAKYVLLPANDSRSGAFTFGVNSAPKGKTTNIIGCGGWVCRDASTEVTDPTQVATNDFMEGGVNLDTLGFAGCVNTFIPHTRSSQSFTSVLKDFGGPINLNTCSITTTPSAAAVEINHSVTDSAVVDGFAGTPAKVDFTVFGPFNNAANVSCSGAPAATFLGVGTSDTGAPAHYTSPPFTPTAPGLYQFVASYSGGVTFTGCGDATEQFTAVDANITIRPLTATNAVGATHTLVAHVNVTNPPSAAMSYINAPANTTVNFTVTNGNGATATPASGSCLTILVTGECTFTISSPTAGTSSIQASTAVVVDGVTVARSTGDSHAGDSASAAKTWVDANIQITPAAATNAVGSAHKLTATVMVNDGSSPSYSAAPDGTSVTFSLSNANGATATFVGGINTCITSSGSCSVSINSPTPGQVTINATTTLTVGGVSLTRSTGDTNAGDSVNANKTFVDANIQITPTNASNAVGTPHLLSAHVNVNDGTGFVSAPDGTVIKFSIVSGPGTLSAPSCTTAGGTGSCTDTLTSAVAGNTVVNATTTVTIMPSNGISVTLTRSTGDTNAGDSVNANKTFVDANIQITPTNASNAVGTPHLLSAHVNVNDGTGFVSAPDGTVISFSIVSGPGTLSAPSCTTAGGTGSCTDTLTSAVAGNTVVNATTTVTIMPSNGISVTLTRSTGDTNAGDSVNANKTFVDAFITITPQTATNPVGTNHVLTATVMVNDGTGFVLAPDGTTISFSIGSGPGSFVGPSTCTTSGATGSCTATITSNVVGTTEVKATTTVTITPANGLPVTLTRSTGDANVGDSSDALKTWNPFHPSITTSLGAATILNSGTVTDTATLNGSSGASTATGAITISVYSGSGASACVAGNLVTSMTASPATAGDGSYTATFSGLAAGNYEFQASFAGDAFDLPATSACGSEPLLVQNQPSITTSLSASSINLSDSVTDTATLSGATSNATGVITINVYTGSDASACVAANLVQSKTASPATNGNGAYTATLSGLAVGSYEFQATYAGDTFNKPATSACGTEPLTVKNPQVSQITPTTTTCSQFSGGTSATLSTVQYSTKSGVISQVDPGVFFYWVKLTSVGSGSQTFTITQSNTGLPIANTSNIFLIGAGSNAFDSNCNTLATKVTQDPKTGAVTVTFNAGSGGTIFIGVKYSTGNVVGESVPTPGEIWTYVFATTGVTGSTSNITLSPKF